MNPQTALEASGIHFLGDHDPRNMNQEEFEKSPFILYHPARQPFTFAQHFDANLPEYFLEGNNSETLGEGFYTTSDREEAQARSKAKQGAPQSLPILISVLPYQTRMMDFRERSNPKINGPVPSTMAQRWYQFFTDYFHSTGRENLPWTITQHEERYYLYLREVVRVPNLDLRVMLGTVASSQSPALPNPPWSKLFANFIIREGLDGIIYNEPSSLHPQKTAPISVFFTLNKVGTFESWKTPQVTAQPQRPS